MVYIFYARSVAVYLLEKLQMKEKDEIILIVFLLLYGGNHPKIALKSLRLNII